MEGTGGGVLCPDINKNKIILNEAEEGKGEQLRAGKPRHEDDMTEDRHSVGREEFRGMNGLEKKYNLVVVGAGLSGSVVAERASKLLGLKVVLTLVRAVQHRTDSFRVSSSTREITSEVTATTTLTSTGSEPPDMGSISSTPSTTE